MTPSVRRVLQWILAAIAVLALVLVMTGAWQALVEGEDAEQDGWPHGCRPPPAEDEPTGEASTRGRRVLQPPPLDGGLPLTRQAALRALLVDEPEPADDPEPDGGIDTAVVPVPTAQIDISDRLVLPAPELGHVRAPSLSPGATHVAFERPGDGLFVVPLTGAPGEGATRVDVPDPGRAEPRHKTWLDGALVFEATRGEPRLFRGIGGAPAVEVVPSVDLVGRLTAPAASADGRWLAFVGNTHGNGDIKLRDEGSGAIVDLGVTRASEDRPAFDASGALLAYERDGRAIVVTERATRAERAVVSGSGRHARPAFAGDRLVFLRQNPGGAWALVTAATAGTAGTAGTELRVLATGVRAPDPGPLAVSPDGRVVVAWADLQRTGVLTLLGLDGSAVDLLTGLVDVGEPALAVRDGVDVLAFTARQSADSPHRDLVVATLPGR